VSEGGEVTGARVGAVDGAANGNEVGEVVGAFVGAADGGKVTGIRV
jgi:hypothetical protein